MKRDKDGWNMERVVMAVLALAVAAHGHGHEKMDMGKMDMEKMDMEKMDMGKMDMGKMDMKMEKMDMKNMDMGSMDMDMARGHMGNMNMEMGDMEHEHEDPSICEREAFRSTRVNHDGGGNRTVDDVAYVHHFEMAHGNCQKGQYDYIFNRDKSETATIQTKNGCSGVFTLAYLVAHCDTVMLDSTTDDGDYVIHELKRPCFNAAVYKMEVKKEMGSGHCILGDSFGFKNPMDEEKGKKKAMVWADKGCKAMFKVCELSNDLAAREMGHMDLAAREMGHMMAGHH